MYPNASQGIRTCPNESKHIRKLRKTSEQFENLCKNFEKLSRKRPKTLKIVKIHKNYVKNYEIVQLGGGGPPVQKGSVTPLEYHFGALGGSRMYNVHS